LRVLESGPWQEKQFSAKMGWMCSLKESFAPFEAGEETKASAPLDSGADAGAGLALNPIWDNNAKTAKIVAPERKIRRIGVKEKTKKNPI
jgi:hypothetical protein